MIDSHCHLDREPLISNLSQVLTRAKNVGLEKLLTICTTNSGYDNILDIVSSKKSKDEQQDYWGRRDWFRFLLQ